MKIHIGDDMVRCFDLINRVLVTLDKKKLAVRLLTGITVLFLIIAGSPFTDIGTRGVDAATNPYAGPSINNLTSSVPTSSGSFISWDSNESTNNRVYLGLNDTEVNILVNGTYSQWNNNTLNVNIRLSGLTANTTYYYKPESWASGVVNNSVQAKAFTTLKPGVWASPSEYMVSPPGWMGSPINFRTVNISAAILNNNGRYISGLSPEAVIYNSKGIEIGRITLNGNGPYSGNFILPDYSEEGGYIIRITGYSIGGEFSVLKWGCANCHRDGAYPSTFDPGTVHPQHFDTTNVNVNVQHTAERISVTSTTQCMECHEPIYPDWITHPTSGVCSDCHIEPSYPNAALACENCHNDRTTNQNVLSPLYGVDKHTNLACGNCHGTLTSITTKPNCTTCHPRPGSILNNTSIPNSIENKSHSTGQTVACGLCHNREHDVKSLQTLDATVCRNCHPDINHDAGNQCTNCHGTDPHEVTFAGGETCIECHGTNYTGANPVARITLVDIYAFNESIHRDINATMPRGSLTNDDCWMCHYQKDMNRQNIRKCGDCHRKPKQWHGNAEITTNLSELW